MIRKIILLLMFPNLMLAQNIEKLATFGFENLQERYQKDTYTLFYEDNLYRFPADGLYKVIDLIEPNNKAGDIKVVILNKGIEIVEMVFKTEDLKRYKQNEIDFESLLSKSIIDFTDAKVDSNPVTNRSYFKTDLSLRFKIDYTLGNFDNPIRQRVNFQPLLSSDLSKGVNLEGYYNVPKFDELGNLEPQVGMLRLSNDFKLNKSGFLNLNYGFYTINRFGLSMNYLKFLYKDQLRFKLHTGITRFGRLNKDLILFYEPSINLVIDYYGDLTYRIHKYNMDTTFRYGSFIFGDLGYSIQVRRFSKRRFIGLFYKKTTFGTMVGFDFSLPIPIKKYNRKRPVRVKLYDDFYMPYNYRSDSQVAELYYEGDNIISQMTNYFPGMLRKGLITASKKGL